MFKMIIGQLLSPASLLGKINSITRLQLDALIRLVGGSCFSLNQFRLHLHYSRLKYSQKSNCHTLEISPVRSCQGLQQCLPLQACVNIHFLCSAVPIRGKHTQRETAASFFWSYFFLSPWVTHQSCLPKNLGYGTAVITATSQTTRFILYYSSSPVTLGTKLMGKQKAALAAVSLWVFFFPETKSQKKSVREVWSERVGGWTLRLIAVLHFHNLIQLSVECALSDSKAFFQADATTTPDPTWPTVQVWIFLLVQTLCFPHPHDNQVSPTANRESSPSGKTWRSLIHMLKIRTPLRPATLFLPDLSSVKDSRWKQKLLRIVSVHASSKHFGVMDDWGRAFLLKPLPSTSATPVCFFTIISVISPVRRASTIVAHSNSVIMPPSKIK